MKNTQHGARFITFEGIDGAGKTTHLRWFSQRLENKLREQGKQLIVTREPGGTPLGEHLRNLVLQQPMHLETETLLVFAARQEHLVQVIQPALLRGDWVLSDRFTDATFAYQGGGCGVSADKLSILENWVHEAFQPDLTLLFDLDIKVARKRLMDARDPDKFESKSEDFFTRTRLAYLERARAYPHRFIIINADQPIHLIQQEIEDKVFPLCFA